MNQLEKKGVKLHLAASFPNENPWPVLRINREGEILYANHSSNALLNLWGSAVGDIAPDDILAITQNCLSTGIKAKLELDIAGQSVVLNFVPIIGQSYLNIYAHDITERKASELALQFSEERLAMVLEGGQHGFWDWNIETGEVQRNEHWAEMLGYTTIEEFENNTDTWTDNIHPDDRDSAWAVINDHLEGRTPRYEIEYRMLTKSGGYKWVLDQAKVVKRDAMGRPLRMCGTHTDITERKRKEDEYIARTNLLEMFYKYTHDCIVLLDRDFNFIRVNDAYAKSCGRDVSDFPGHNHFEFYPSELIDAFKNVVKTKESYNIQARPFEFLDHPEWGVTYWDLTLIPLLDSSGEVDLLLFTLKDVTKRTLAVKEKEQLQKQLQQAQKMESIGQLTGGIAHDFNNMLSSVLGYSELAIRHISADPESKLNQYLDEILHAGERGRNLVAKMLAFGRTNLGELQSVDGVSLITEVIKMLRPTLPSSLNITTVIEDDVSPLLVDPVQLNQVITNITINARHVVDEHGKIELGLHELHLLKDVCSSCHQEFAGEFVEINVRDDGQGISNEHLDRIFEPFFTTKQVGVGSGMGLSMVHGIVHQCGGHILVETEQGVGSNFRLFFKPALTEGLDAVMNNAVPSVRAVENKCIMVVDDETGILGYLKELLSSMGYQVRAYDDPLAALKAFKSDPGSIDLVITDQTMPKMTGAKLAQNLLSLRSSLPVILCTGFSETIDESGAQHLGIAAFLRKPADSDELLSTIAKLLT